MSKYHRHYGARPLRIKAKPRPKLTPEQQAQLDAHYERVRDYHRQLRKQYGL